MEISRCYTDLRLYNRSKRWKEIKINPTDVLTAVVQGG